MKANKALNYENIIPFSNGKIDTSVIPWGGSGSLNEVTSVAGRIGDVVLTADDVAATVAKLWLDPAERAKLAAIEANAEVNVNADWNAVSGDAVIFNKPSIPTLTSQLTNNSNFVVDAAYVHTENNLTDALIDKLVGIAAGAEVNVQSDWNAVSGDSAILNKPVNATALVGGFMSATDKDKLDNIDTGWFVQSDWTQTNSAAKDFIKNKPTLPTHLSQLINDSGYLTSISWANVTGKPTFATVATTGSYTDLINKPTIPTLLSQLFNDKGFIVDFNYNHTDNNFTDAFLAKLQTVANGAEVNVQADWDELDVSSDAYILNKPVIPVLISELTNDANYLTDPLGYTHTEENFSTLDKAKLDSLIAGGEPNVQSDWDETNATLDSYILNKPIFNTVATTGSYNDLLDTPTIPTSIFDFADVSDAGIGVGKVLKWNGTAFVPSSDETGTGGTALSSLSDVNVTGATSGDVLQYNGSVWVPATVSGGGGGATTLLELTDTPDVYAANRFVITNGTGDGIIFASLGLGNMSDCNTTGVVTGDLLQFDGTDFVVKATNELGLSVDDLTEASAGVEGDMLYRATAGWELRDVDYMKSLIEIFTSHITVQQWRDTYIGDSATPLTVTIPVDCEKRFFSVVAAGTGGVTIEAANGVTINGVNAGSIQVTTQYSGVAFVKLANNAYIAINK